MTKLSEVIHIPEQVTADDYVLRLTSWLDDQAGRALDSYVVTDQIAEAFDSALGLVGSSLTDGESRGAFLMGSFGSGKSHFMAVLHALLRHNPDARSKQGLPEVVARHDAQLGGKNVLPLAFHMLDATTFDDALFSGYIRQIRERHPGAPLPPLHHTDGLLSDARTLRTRMGDDAFFNALNGDTPPSDAATGEVGQYDDLWGDVVEGDARWDAPSFDAALAAAPDSETRRQLVTDVVNTFFKNFTQQNSWVPLEAGLDAIATHAAGLGYHGVVLFLDELVLWLSTLVRSDRFGTEAQKITKLVESATGRRRIPLISFIARQLDLRMGLADAPGVSGAEQRDLEQGLRYQEGRFGKIELGDTNLPHVANRRLLQPIDEHAAALLRKSFDRIDRTPRVWDVLLDGVNTDADHRGADEEMFRLTYPFSPALMSTLKSLAGVMQRERTALKVMQQMLVDRRDTLTVDDVIPVGDAYDHVMRSTQGGHTVDPQAAGVFKTADRLYTDKLRDLLLANHQLPPAALADPGSLPRGYLTDDRIVKTLLLAAVAPNVPALKDLTASRLASLNHGSIVSIVPGGEGAQIAGKVRSWAQAVPEIHVGDGPDPVIRVRVSDVDYERVIERAKGIDTDGEQRTYVTRMMLEALELGHLGEGINGAYATTHVWRGSRRPVELYFGNVRDSAQVHDDAFRPSDRDTWRIVIDHPFDVGNHSPADDQRRLDELRARGVEGNTLVWVPHFLSENLHRELRRLVVIDWVLTGDDRWTRNADHLSETERAQARAILESMRDGLRARVRQALLEAYGVIGANSGTLLDSGRSETVLSSLNNALGVVAPDRGTDFRSAFAQVLDQAFTATWPAHPDFQPGDQEVRTVELKRTLEYLEAAMEEPQRRVRLQGDTVGVRRVANALEVGRAAETHFLFGDEHFALNTVLQRELGRLGRSDRDAVTVGELRNIIAGLEPARGLQPLVVDLVIRAWALLRQRAWFEHGQQVAAPPLGALTSTMELRVERLPEREQYATAAARAGTVLGVSAAQIMTPRNVQQLAASVRDAAVAMRPALQRLIDRLRQVGPRLGIDEADFPRLAAAEEVLALTSILAGRDDTTLVASFAERALRHEPAVLGATVAHADEVTTKLGAITWMLVEPALAARNTDDAARNAVTPLATAVRRDEHAQPLGEAVSNANDAVARWAVGRPGPTPPQPPTPSTDPDDVPLDQVRRGSFVSRGRGDRDRALTALREFFDTHPDREIEVRWEIR